MIAVATQSAPAVPPGLLVRLAAAHQTLAVCVADLSYFLRAMHRNRPRHDPDIALCAHRFFLLEVSLTVVLVWDDFLSMMTSLK